MSRGRRGLRTRAKHMAIYRGRERALLAKMMIGLVKIIHRGKFGPGASLAGEVETLLLAAAVLLGDVAGRPKSASDIARIMNIPRSTAIRKLAHLIDARVIERQGRRYHTRDVGIENNDAYIDEGLAFIKSVQNGHIKVDLEP